MDAKHFPDFYRKNVKRIYRFLYFRVKGNKEVAEDLTQDVFMKAFKAFESYDPAVSESSWLYTIARNHLINYVQKERPGASLEEIENTVWDREPWDDKMASKHDHGRLSEAIKLLPSDDQKIVQLKYIEGWSYEEIAPIIGKNAVALRVQSFRALKALKAILKQK